MQVIKLSDLKIIDEPKNPPCLIGKFENQSEYHLENHFAHIRGLRVVCIFI